MASTLLAPRVIHVDRNGAIQASSGSATPTQLFQLLRLREMFSRNTLSGHSSAQGLSKARNQDMFLVALRRLFGRYRISTRLWHHRKLVLRGL